jgi:hypothetical protein
MECPSWDFRSVWHIPVATIWMRHSFGRRGESSICSKDRGIPGPEATRASVFIVDGEWILDFGFWILILKCGVGLGRGRIVGLILIGQLIGPNCRDHRVRCEIC